MSKLGLGQSIYLDEIMLFVMIHSYIKAVVFLELLKATSFSMPLTFWISTVILIILMDYYVLNST